MRVPRPITHQRFSVWRSVGLNDHKAGGDARLNRDAMGPRPTDRLVRSAQVSAWVWNVTSSKEAKTSDDLTAS